MTFRDSVFSTSSSNTYPSSMSSLSLSALGLTDSPIHPRTRKTPSSATSSPAASPRQAPSIRPSASRASLRQEAATNAASRLPRQPSTELLRSSEHRPSQSNLKDAAAPRPSSQANGASVSQTSAPRGPPAAGRPVQTQQAQQARNAPPSRSQVTQTRPRPAQAPAEIASPARTEKPTFADEWEAELVKNARNLNLGPNAGPQKSDLSRERAEQKRKDKEWEESGTWETGRDAAREAEDRVRRDASRGIAYPPATPRVPIRAAPTGPDHNVPIPLFTPSQAYSDLPGEAVQGSYNTRYDPKIMDKAKKEYEDWLARKADREGGMGGDDAGGTRDWHPKERAVARPRVDTAHPPGANLAQPIGSAKTVITTPTEAAQVWVHPHPTSQTAHSAQDVQNPVDHVQMDQAQQAAYAQQMPPGQEMFYGQGYWDPGYWWGMMGDGGSMISADQQGKGVHFAESQDDQQATHHMTAEEQQAAYEEM
ncbi:hypothetical protein IAT38_008294 [Cryptococcus sp. DSM 104549]